MHIMQCLNDMQVHTVIPRKFVFCKCWIILATTTEFMYVKLCIKNLSPEGKPALWAASIFRVEFCSRSECTKTRHRFVCI